MPSDMSLTDWGSSIRDIIKGVTQSSWSASNEVPTDTAELVCRDYIDQIRENPCISTKMRDISDDPLMKSCEYTIRCSIEMIVNNFGSCSEKTGIPLHTNTVTAIFNDSNQVVLTIVEYKGFSTSNPNIYYINGYVQDPQMVRDIICKLLELVGITHTDVELSGSSSASSSHNTTPATEKVKPSRYSYYL